MSAMDDYYEAKAVAMAAGPEQSYDAAADAAYWARRAFEQDSSYDLPENSHVRDWGHESDFQFDDDGECGEDLPF